MMEVKEPKPLEFQLNKLKERGCVIGDEVFARQVLQKINYYRLTAYFLPFKKADGKYIDGTTFNNVYRIYDFDRRLRILLLSVIENIELMLRARLSFFSASKYGSLGYMREENYLPHHNHTAFAEHINKSIKNNKNQAFVKHHIKVYDGKFPIWVIIELFTTGELSLFYSDMIVQDKKEIAYKLFGTTYTNLSNWLHCLTNLRNYCAHYSRLYYNLFPAIPPTPKGFSYTLGKRIFDYILVLKFLYPSPERLEQDMVTPLQTLIDEYSDCIKLKHIGFPENWQEILREPVPKRSKPVGKRAR